MIGADSRWGREQGWLGLRQEMPEDPTESAHKVGRAASVSETSRAKGEQRPRRTKREKKNSFFVEPNFFVLSKPEGLLMWKGIFELLEDALGMENGLRSLDLGQLFERGCLETFLQSSVAGSQDRETLFMLEALHPSDS